MNREEFRIKAKQSIDDAVGKIDALEQKKDKVKADARAEYEKKLSELKLRRDELKQKYNDLADASDKKRQEIKQAFSSASDSFKDGFQKISELFH